MMALRIITCAAVAGSVAGTVNLDIEDGKLAQHRGRDIFFNQEECKDDSWNFVPPANLPSYYLTKDNRTLQTFRRDVERWAPTEESLPSLCELAPTKDLLEKCGVCHCSDVDGFWSYYVTFCSVDGTQIYRQPYERAGCQQPYRHEVREKNVAQREPTCAEPKAIRYEGGTSVRRGHPYHFPTRWMKKMDSGNWYGLPAAPAPPPPRPAPAPPPPAPAPAPASWAQRALVADEGNNLKSLDSATPDNCKAECEALTACHSFAFSESKRRCHLKDKCVTQSDATDHGNPGHVGYVTHYKPCQQDEVLV